MQIRLNLVDAARDVCPPPPPCFLNRTSWLEYLESAAVAQHQRGEPKVILIVDQEPRMNPDFDFCCDCTSKLSAEMSKHGKCQPDFLKTTLKEAA